ncbi:MAG TPA: hypothetical protein VMR75_03675 [Candidatus Saccharimonadales bacterium]|nr:hypothetical protein [Candidatus Saccharimonadales bacterium]
MAYGTACANRARVTPALATRPLPPINLSPTISPHARAISGTEILITFNPFAHGPMKYLARSLDTYDVKPEADIIVDPENPKEFVIVDEEVDPSFYDLSCYAGRSFRVQRLSFTTPLHRCRVEGFGARLVGGPDVWLYIRPADRLVMVGKG